MSADRDFSMHLRGAYLTMHRVANARFARFGVTADQYVVLNALSSGEALTQQDLVRRIYSDPNTLRAILVRLESQGLVSRAENSKDRRARTVALTSRGREVQQELNAFNEPFQRELSTLFRDEEERSLMTYLDRISQAMSSIEARRL